jgi:hypothetical protein
VQSDLVDQRRGAHWNHSADYCETDLLTAPYLLADCWIVFASGYWLAGEPLRVTRSRARSRAVAFHEAAHAVARLHVGAPATAVRIIPTGFTHGTRRWAGRGQDRVWSWILVLFAGSYAQAWVSRRRLDRVIITSGKLDLEEAAPAVAWLVRRGYARNRMEALTRIHWETLMFLALRWNAIERVAAALLRDGRLSGSRVRALALTADSTMPRNRKDAARIRAGRPR